MQGRVVIIQTYSAWCTTQKRLERIPYFQMEVGTPLELEGRHACDYGTKYEGDQDHGRRRERAVHRYHAVHRQTRQCGHDRTGPEWSRASGHLLFQARM